MKYRLRHIRYFLTVAEELHFRRAAEKMNVAQPAVSRGIRQLEQDIGVRLLDRSNKRVALTDAGRVFMAGCKTSFEHLQRAVTEAQGVHAGSLGTLRIAYTDLAINGCFPAIVEQFRGRYEGVKLTLEHQFTNQQIDNLENGRLDIGFLTGPVDRIDFDTRLIQQERFIVALYPSHPLAEMTEIPLAALAHEPFVIGDLDTWQYFHDHLFRLCRTAGFEPRVAQTASNTDGIFGLVASGMGISILSEGALVNRRQGVMAAPLKDCPTTISTFAAWRREPGSPLTLKFGEFLNSEFRPQLP